MVVSVIKVSFGNHQLCNLLCLGREIVIYKKLLTTRILASHIKKDSTKRHFVIPTSYKGKFKRRPRTFPTAYDLEIARSGREKLHVIATKAFACNQGELCSVSVGDHFLVPQCKVLDPRRRKVVETTLACEQMLSLNKAYKNVLLPMWMEGGFVEIVHDNSQYELMDLCKDYGLPFNVQVSERDLSILEDILAGIQGLQLEEEITDSCLLISSFNKPKEIWEIPVHRLSMSVQLLNKHTESVVCFPTKAIVEEITEEQYCMMRRYENQASIPPPRPPKTHKSESTKMTSVFLAQAQYVWDTATPMKVGSIPYA